MPQLREPRSASPIEPVTAPQRRSRRPPETSVREARLAGLETDWDALAPSGWYPRWGPFLLDMALMIVVVPPALVIGLVIACVNTALFRDPGKVFFIQPRVGLRGRQFKIVKFRTMRVVKDEFRSWREEEHLRVTAFGKFLRDTHLDELPQIFNVLVGDMHFVGPRPEMVEVERWACEHIPGFFTRLVTKPGISGLAQVSLGYTNQSVAAYKEKLRINDRYRREISFGLDLWIVWRTVVRVLSGANGSGPFRTRSTQRRAPGGSDDVDRRAALEGASGPRVGHGE